MVEKKKETDRVPLEKKGPYFDGGEPALNLGMKTKKGGKGTSAGVSRKGS